MLVRGWVCAFCVFVCMYAYMQFVNSDAALGYAKSRLLKHEFEKKKKLIAKRKEKNVKSIECGRNIVNA